VSYSSKKDPNIGLFLLTYEFVPYLAVFAHLSDPGITAAGPHKGGSASGFGVEDAEHKERSKSTTKPNFARFSTLPPVSGTATRSGTKPSSAYTQAIADRF
jgi:hypothetical protein